MAVQACLIDTISLVAAAAAATGFVREFTNAGRACLAFLSWATCMDASKRLEQCFGDKMDQTPMHG